MSKFAAILKKNGKLVVGLVGLAAVIAWSGGFLARKVEPGKLEHPAGIAVPAETATVAVKVENAPVRVEVVDAEAPETGAEA